MEEHKPSFNTEPVADYNEPKDVLDAFLEYSGMDFWKLVAEE
jgi:hypothetical protein